MKKNILLLINGFGIQRSDSYSVYSAELMPNLDNLINTKIFKSISNNYLDYKSAYRNFSMGIDDALTYNLIENNIYKLEYSENPLMKYIIQELNKNDKSKLHIFCYWDSPRTAEQIATYVKEISSKVKTKIIIHLILCQNGLDDYKYIERSFTTLNYELGVNVKIGIITGEENLGNVLAFKEVIKTLVTEYGEKYKEIGKKIESQVQSKIPPSKTRTFALSYGFGFDDYDKVLFFNYSNVDVSNYKKELELQRFRKLDTTTIQYFSLFPVKSEQQIPFMYNYAVASSYALNSLKSINAKCLVFDLKEKCPFINYYLTGLKNEVDPNLKYMPTDDGFIYNKDLVISNLDAQKDKDIIILNYDISDCKTVEDLKERLKQIDVVVGAVHDYTTNNKYGLFISSLYGFQRDMYNEKHELCSINFSGRVPVVIDDSGIITGNYNIEEGNLHDLADTIYKNTNSDYKEMGLLRKKSNLLSFLYKKPKGK